MSLFIKICGLRHPSEVEACIDNGADAVGFVLSDSPRRVTLEQARQLGAVAPSYLQSVLVVRQLQELQPNLVPPRFALQGSLPNPGFPSSSLIPTLRDGPNLLERALTTWALLGPHTLLLIDGRSPGSGTCSNWDRVAQVAQIGPVCLAGGLTPDNVYHAIERVRPVGVDVSSGVESTRGQKDLTRIRDFIQAAQDAATTLKRDAPCTP